VQLQLDAAVLLQHLDVEIRMALEDAERVVVLAAGGEHGQRAAAQQSVQAALARVAQASHLVAREHVHARDRADAGVDRRGRG
jgi:hypothetical protein